MTPSSRRFSCTFALFAVAVLHAVRIFVLRLVLCIRFYFRVVCIVISCVLIVVDLLFGGWFFSQIVVRRDEGDGRLSRRYSFSILLCNC